MKNLAGVESSRANAVVMDELARARIPVCVVDPGRSEVQATFGGALKGFTFTRAWYYWVVHGRMPLELAKELYADPEGKITVRVAGHCGCPPPEDPWIEYRAFKDGKEYEILHGETNLRELERGANADPTSFSYEWAHKTVPEKYIVSLNPWAVPGVVATVDSYHVDDQAGLRLIADFIHRLPVWQPESK